MADPVAALAKLGKYLVGAPSADGEWGMRCPMPDHPDNKRSASINFEKDIWYCQRCQKGGPLTKLLDQIEDQDDLEAGRKPALPKPLDPGDVRTYCKVLMSDIALIKRLQKRRGLSVQTLKDFDIGYDLVTRRFTIPVYDESGALVNIRKYDPDSTRGDKMISVFGHGHPSLYPVQQLKGKGPVVVCEGELDALTLIQNGFTAVTRTGAASVWLDQWSEYLFGREVYVCHDADAAGQAANAKVAQALKSVAGKVVVVDLGYEVKEKHGEDVTDFFWRDKHNAHDFKRLMAETLPITEAVIVTSLLESTNGLNFNKVMQMRGTVQSRSDQTLVIPATVHVQCSQDFDEEICPRCPMGQVHGGVKLVDISKYKPKVMDYAFMNRGEIVKEFKREQRIPKDCPRVSVEPLAMHTVEFARLAEPMDDDDNTNISSRLHRRAVYFIGKHDTEPSQTMEVTGRMYVHPKTNTNEFVVLDAKRVDTQIDKFQLTDEMLEELADFQLLEGTATDKLRFIARDLSSSVTRIFARDDMHIVMDLAWHSALQFFFEGTLQEKGWLDIAILGETRTGKSEAAKKLNQWYKLGQTISCESATFAGILGGMTQTPTKGWEVSWGVLPYNDRRLVVLDEASGLSREQIGQLSQVRSSGRASMHKIESNFECMARTRLVWIGNPRDGGITRGVRMLDDIFGNPEDIARLDLAMSVHSGDPGTNVINRPKLRPDVTGTFVSQDAYRNLVLWAWTRRPEDIEWEPGVEGYILKQAIRLGATFISQPPLVQESSVRHKLARLSVAVACRLFSTYDAVTVKVTRDHVQAALDLMLRCYQNPKFAYYSESKVAINIRKDAGEAYYETKEWLVGDPAMCDYLRQNLGRPITVPHMRDALGMPFNSASGVMSELRKRGLVQDTQKPSHTPTVVSTQLLERLLGDIPG